MSWFTIENIETVDSPALVLYTERIQQNILHAIDMIKDISKLRPHVKTNKISEVCKMMMNAGISKFKCATIAEAEMLALIEAPDVLLAYQPVGPKATRLKQLVITYPQTHFSCLVDNVEVAQQLSSLFEEHHLVIDVYIDINSGMNRTGIVPSHALQLFEAIHLLPGIHVAGLHAYDGHIRDTDTGERQHKSDDAFKKVMILAETIESIAKRNVNIVAGGSPTFPTHIERHVECSPGTFVFWDWGYKHTLPDEPFEYAALVVTRVVSIIDEQTICTDLGHKSVAAENPLPRVYFLNDEQVTPVSQSEEHMVAKVANASNYKTGDVLYGVPLHICPTVALYDSAVVVKNNKAVDEWAVIARDRKINI